MQTAKSDFVPLVIGLVVLALTCLLTLALLTRVAVLMFRWAIA